MTALLQLSDFEQLRPLSANLNEQKKLLPYVIEAQQFDLKPLIGNAFYLALVNDFNASPSLGIYSDLWNGCEWTDSGYTYRHEGLKSVLIQFSYCRYILNASQTETAFGVQIKLESNSEHISEKTTLRKADDARSGAMAYWEDVKKFLCDNSEDYPLWNYCKSQSKSLFYGVEPLDECNSYNYKKNRRKRH